MTPGPRAAEVDGGSQEHLRTSIRVFPDGRLQVVSEPEASTWTFLTNHAHVLLCIRRDPDIRLRDVAQLVGITERATQKIVADLGEAGYLSVERVGRRNRYSIEGRQPLRHPLERSHEVGELLDLLETNGPA